jgi:nucleotide-binding universal stress UspA family protein
MKILIAYDGSECADAALIDLQRAGLPDEVEALILSAVDVFIPPKPDVKDLDEPFVNYVPHGVKIARKRAREAFEESKIIAAQAGGKVQKMFPEWTVTNEAQPDPPHWAIIAKAREWKPDLTVVGSHGRSALGRLILGSVSQKVLYETECSVRIARGKSEKSPDDPVRLVLGVDGSPDSDAMLDVVASRNWKQGTDVKIITAVESFHQYAVEADVQLSRVRDIQTVAVEKLSAAGLIVSMMITEEDPKYFLVRQAELWEADCIFLGAKGHRFLERLLIGSVSSSVAARAHCSVEVVRRKIV